MRGLVLLLIAAATAGFAHGATCIGEDGAPVDWFFIYKLPDGLRYTYRDANSVAQATPLEPFVGKTLNCGSQCALGATLSQIYKNKASLAYAAYNDEPVTADSHALRSPDFKSTDPRALNDTDPDDSTTTGGHTKGVIAFNASAGFWLVHSVPVFPDLAANAFTWQASQTYGQSFLCISLNPDTDIDGISKQMQVTHPDIYSSNLPSNLHPVSTEFESLLNKKYLEGSSKFAWTSPGRMQFTSFTKAPTWGADLYEDLVIPGLAVTQGFQWETWRRSPFLPAYCAGAAGHKYTSTNVEDVALGADPTNTFKYTQDHSKWGISLASSQPYVCVGDINRMQSQRARGGGTVCFLSRGLWGSLGQAVKLADTCPAA